jgi:hypothetical protein
MATTLPRMNAFARLGRNLQGRRRCHSRRRPLGVDWLGAKVRLLVMVFLITNPAISARAATPRQCHYDSAII